MAKKILVADDSQTIQRAVEIALFELQAEIVQVFKASDVLSKAKEIHPDLILLDNRMNREGRDDGYDLCKKIREEGSLSSLPLIFLAGRSYDGKRGLEVGGNDSIDKPFETQTVLDKVRSWLEKGAAPAVSQELAAPRPVTARAGGPLRETTAMPTFNPVDLQQMLPKDIFGTKPPTPPPQAATPTPPPIDPFASLPFATEEPSPSLVSPMSFLEEPPLPPPPPTPMFQPSSFDDDLPAPPAPPAPPSPFFSSPSADDEDLAPPADLFSSSPVERIAPPADLFAEPPPTPLPPPPVDLFAPPPPPPSPAPSPFAAEPEEDEIDLSPPVPPFAPPSPPAFAPASLVSQSPPLMTPPPVSPPQPTLESRPLRQPPVIPLPTEIPTEFPVKELVRAAPLLPSSSFAPPPPPVSPPSPAPASPSSLPPAPRVAPPSRLAASHPAEEMDVEIQAPVFNEAPKPAPPPDFALKPEQDYLARALKGSRSTRFRRSAQASSAAEAVQIQFIQTMSRDVIERIAWEVVPELAELIVRDVLSKQHP